MRRHLPESIALVAAVGAAVAGLLAAVAGIRASVTVLSFSVALGMVSLAWALRRLLLLRLLCWSGGDRALRLRRLLLRHPLLLRRLRGSHGVPGHARALLRLVPRACRS